ncbi:MAG: hypothetical protein RR314_00020 [Oscillospiraceae bacterium]
MEFQTVSADCVALYIRERPDSPGDAAELVRSALTRRGLKLWPRMELDLFPAEGETLIVARPVSDISVTVADWALQFFNFE